MAKLCKNLALNDSVATEADVAASVKYTVQQLTADERVQARANIRAAGQCESVTWAALKALRDGGQLVPGQQYRITDYVATTNGDMSSQSANHPFDIIVTADSANALNEEARAALHAGDAYFAGCNLAAWKVWYCLDNDADRFAWAVTTSTNDVPDGRGVVYRLIDEWGNDVAYDFKGLRFSRTDSSTTTWYYTFDKNGVDRSLARSSSVSGNVLLPDDSYANKHRLNNIVFKSATSVFNNRFGRHSNSCTFAGGMVYDNVFGENFKNSTFSATVNYVQGNVFGAGCYGISASLAVVGCVFGACCHDMTFTGHAIYCAFGTGCYNITAGRVEKLVMGAECYNITLGTNSYYSFFGTGCASITAGYGFTRNSIGAACQDLVFGEYVTDVSVGTNCRGITLGSSSAAKSYCRNITVGAGCSNLYLDPTGTTSGSIYYQNVTVLPGVSGASSNNRKTISDPNVGQAFHTTYKPANSQEVSV